MFEKKDLNQVFFFQFFYTIFEDIMVFNPIYFLIEIGFNFFQVNFDPVQPFFHLQESLALFQAQESPRYRCSARGYHLDQRT